MAREIIGTDKFEYNKILRRFTGEILNDKLKGLYLLMPKMAFASSFLFMFGSALGWNVFAEMFYILSFFFFSISLIFMFMIANERPDIACIGVMNEARDSQLAHIFGFKKAQKRIKYYAAVGVCVYQFLGKDAGEAKRKNLTPKNKKYEMLLDKDVYTMGYLLPGSTGSGKTVTLNTTVFLPAIKSGNGFFYVEGKGDRPITEGIMSFIYQYGRENDVFILDFGAAASGGFTNGLNPLSIGNAKTVGEFMKNLIKIMDGENAWVSQMAIAYLEAMLLPLVLLRDMNLVIKSEELKSIQTFDDFKNKEVVQFNITAVLDYFNFQASIDLYYMMKRMLKDSKFLAEMNKIDEYASLKKDKIENIIGRLKRNLTSLNIDVTSLTEPDYASMDADIKRNHPKAVDDWIQSLEIFGSEKFYGNIFNKDEPDFDAITAIQTGKIIISIIPSMSASLDQCEKMGKMMTSIAKGAIGYMLEKGSLEGDRKTKRRNKRFRPRKLPYGYIFDEPSNYANIDIAQMSSMIRSIGSEGGGMALIWTGQSRTDMDKIDDNKKIASEQLLANLGFTQTLNIQDQGWKELMSKKVGEQYVQRENQFDGKKGNGENDNYRDYRREKEKKYEENYFEKSLRPKTGESIVVAKGYDLDEKLVAGFNEPPSSDLKMNKNISFRQLSTIFKTTEEIDKELTILQKEHLLQIEKGLNAKEGLDQSFEEEVKSAMVLLARVAYPALPGADEFKFTLHTKTNPKAHGMYTPFYRHIEIFNAINKSREHIIATSVHELCHHIEYLNEGDTGHSKRFYKYLHEMLSYAMGIEELAFDYDEAKNKKMLDSNDIRIMERDFGRPISKKIEAA